MTKLVIAPNHVDQRKIVLVEKHVHRENVEINAQHRFHVPKVKYVPEVPVYQAADQTVIVGQPKFVKTENAKMCAKNPTVVVKMQYVKQQIKEKSAFVLTAIKATLKFHVHHTNVELIETVKLTKDAGWTGLVETPV